MIPVPLLVRLVIDLICLGLLVWATLRVVHLLKREAFLRGATALLAAGVPALILQLSGARVAIEVDAVYAAASVAITLSTRGRLDRLARPELRRGSAVAREQEQPGLGFLAMFLGFFFVLEYVYAAPEWMNFWT